MKRLAVVAVVLVILGALTLIPASAQATTPCGASLPTQLAVGGRGAIAQSFSTLRDSPGGNPIQVVFAPGSFTVMGGPACGPADNMTYYQIQYDNGLIGWAAESQVISSWGTNMYWLVATAPPPPPPTPTPVNALCPGGLVNRLTVGGRGQIAQAFSTLRDSPGGNPIQTVSAPAQFTVLAGPTSDGFLCYYQIQYDSGLTGWASEGQLVSAWGSNLYWLAPVAQDTSAG